MPVQVYDDFYAGMAGAGGLYKTNRYGGENCQVYPNGTIGERPGWANMTINGLLMSSSDVLRGLVWRAESGDPLYNGIQYGRLLLIYTNSGDTTIYFEELSVGFTGELTSTGRYSATSSNHPRMSYAIPSYSNELHRTFFNGTELTIVGGTIFEDFDTSSPTFANPNTADGRPSGAWVHRDRAYYFGFASQPGRIYYSEPADYDDVPSTNFFDVNENPSSESGGVINMWTVNNSLLIARADGRWNVLSGVSPETGSNRDLLDTKVPSPGAHAVLWNDEVWFPSADGWGLNVATNAGVDITTWKHLALTDPFDASASHTPVLDVENNWAYFPFENPRAVIGGPNFPDWGLVYTNRVWNYVSDDTDGGLVDLNDEPHIVDYTTGVNGRLFRAHTSDTNSLEIDVRPFSLGRPPNKGRIHLLDGQPLRETGSSYARLWLPEYTATPGSSVRITKVTVDFDYWWLDNTTNYERPLISLIARVIGVEDAGAGDNSYTPSIAREISSGFDGQSDSWEIATGERKTETVDFEDMPFGSGFRMDMEFQSVAIRRVVVSYEERSVDTETA